jgi:hypothetical protein
MRRLMERAMVRVAHCCCGGLRVEAIGDPVIVAACHCRQCQRRTGAAFGVSAYFPKEQVRIGGTSKVFVRDGQDGRKIRAHFCPDCGSTVYWDADFRPDYYGIAVGAFADPTFPAPRWSVWEEARHPWTAFGHQVDQFEQAVPAPALRR